MLFLKGQVMDSTASSLSMDNDIPLVVFNLNEAEISVVPSLVKISEQL